MTETKVPFLKRVRLQNFRSIGRCDVELQPLTLLVGPNGSGKTNFLDALRLVTESLKRPWNEVFAIFANAGDQFGSPPTPFRRHPRSCANLSRLLETYLQTTDSLRIELEFSLPLGWDATYSLTLAPLFEIKEERCVIRDQDSGVVAQYWVIGKDLQKDGVGPAPSPSSDRPYLAVVSAFTEYRPICDAIRSMQFYAVLPDVIRSRSSWAPGYSMLRDGAGLASVLWQIDRERSDVKQRIDDYMRAILPGLKETSVESQKKDLREYLDRDDVNQTAVRPISELVEKMGSFRLHFVMGDNDENLLSFGPSSMSDGTLHALGVLVALFQCRDLPAESAIPLVAIEEPEANLHPGAAEVLMDAMTEASEFTQVIATTHSPDFLDYADLDPKSLLVFDAANGETIVDVADDASVSAIRDRLYSAGELMRMQQLRPKSLQTPASSVGTPEQ